MHSSSWCLFLTKHNCLLPPCVFWKWAVFDFGLVYAFFCWNKNASSQISSLCFWILLVMNLEHLTAHKNFIKVLQPLSSCFLLYFCWRPDYRVEVRQDVLFTLRFAETQVAIHTTRHGIFQVCTLLSYPFFTACLFFFFSLAIPCQPHPSFLTGAFLSRNVHLMNLKIFFLPGG